MYQTFVQYCRRAAKMAMQSSSSYVNTIGCYDTAAVLLDVLEDRAGCHQPALLRTIGEVNADMYNEEAVAKLSSMAFELIQVEPQLYDELEMAMFGAFYGSEAEKAYWRETYSEEKVS